MPDIDFRRISQFRFTDVNSLPLSINVNSVSFIDSGGNGRIDPGETIRLRLPLENYTLNPLSRSSAQNVTALLLSQTPGIDVIQSIGLYGKIQSGQTAEFLEYRLRVGAGFDPGTLIELKLLAIGRFGHPLRSPPRSCATRCSPARQRKRRCLRSIQRRRARRHPGRMDPGTRRRR